MARIHVNPDTGKTGPCDAKIACRFGEDTPHFETEGEARAYYEKQNAHREVSSMRKHMKLMAVGGALVASISLSACSTPVSASSDEPDPRISQTTGIHVHGHPAPPVNSASATARPGAEWVYPSDGVKDGAGKALDTLKDKAKGTWDKSGIDGDKLKKSTSEALDSLAPYAQQAGDDAKELLRELSQANGGKTAQPGEVMFQGKPLKPSADEVAQAKASLNAIRSQTPNAVEYNREADFGKSFNTGVVGRLEHRDVTDGQFKNPAPQSRAVGGSFIDPYSGMKVTIVKGSKTDSDVDHIVPLKRVKEMAPPEMLGDSPQAKALRNKIANDPINTEVVSSAENRSKGDSSPAEWMPSYKPAQCAYAVEYIKVSKEYNLGMSGVDKATLSNVLATRCS